MCWVQTSTEDMLRDNSAEVLNDLSDEEVREFYLMERDRVKNDRAKKKDVET